jgi:hypothetical protein
MAYWMTMISQGFSRDFSVAEESEKNVAVISDKPVLNYPNISHDKNN